MVIGPSVPPLILNENIYKSFFLEISTDCLLDIRHHTGDTSVDGTTGVPALVEEHKH